MNLNDRIGLLTAVGTIIKSDLDKNRLDELFFKAENENPWFIKSFVEKALKNLVTNFLDKQELIEWTKQYEFNKEFKNIGIVAAGNIPLVGIHDLISVFISGNKAQLKLSAKDSVLMKYVISLMAEIDSTVLNKLEIVNQLKGVDAVIATGSNNTNRYFEQYFGKYPNLLRKNRTSVAIIDEYITDEQLKLIAKDIYSYFGLGCRSVSKVFCHEGFDITNLLKVCSEFEWLTNHYKFNNNYTYQKSIYLVNKVSHFDTGFSIFTEDAGLHSPIAVTYFENFSSLLDLNERLNGLKAQIQIAISNEKDDLQLPVIQFGMAQNTKLIDYADGKNTLEFLANL